MKGDDKVRALERAFKGGDKSVLQELIDERWRRDLPPVEITDSVAVFDDETQRFRSPKNHAILLATPKLGVVIEGPNQRTAPFLWVVITEVTKSDSSFPRWVASRRGVAWPERTLEDAALTAVRILARYREEVAQGWALDGAGKRFERRKNPRPERGPQRDGAWAHVVEAARRERPLERQYAREALEQLYNMELPQTVTVTRQCEACFGDGQGWNEDGNLTGSECEECGGLGEFSDHNACRVTTQRSLAVDMTLCMTAATGRRVDWHLFCHCAGGIVGDGNEQNCLIHGSSMDAGEWSDAMLTALEQFKFSWAQTILCLAERMDFTP